MANIKFKLDCPKCESEIVIRSSAQIGQKTECPKCKYRFTVPDVDEDEDDGDEAPRGKAAKKAGGSKVLIGVVLGVLALGGLALGAVLVLGGDSKKPSTPAVANNNSTTPPAGTGTGAEVPAPEVPAPETEVPAVGPKPVKKPRPSGLKEITNLLPGDAVSVWHLNMDELAKTPMYASVFDTPTKALFLTSMTFDASDVAEILHCYVGADKDAFAIIRTKAALDPDEMLKRLNLESPKNNTVKGREFFLLKSNAFLTAISKSLSLGAILGTEGKSAKVKPAKPGDVRPLAFNIYDSQTIVLADPFLMERFLNDLKADGLPPFKSELTQPEPAAPAETTPMGSPMYPGGGPMGPMGPMGGFPMGPPKGGGARAPRSGDSPEDAQLKPLPAPGSPAGPAPGAPVPNPGNPMNPGGPMYPGAPGGTPAAPARKSFTSNPYFRTIEPDLKKALNTLEDEDKETPAAVYVQRVDQRTLGELDLKALGLPSVADTVLVNWLQQVKVIGFSLTNMGKSKGVATGYFEYLTDDDAKKSVDEHILTVLNALKLLYTLQTLENVTINDLTKGGQGGQPGGGNPMFPGGGGGNPMYPGAGGGNPMFPGGGNPMVPGAPGAGGNIKEPESSAPLQRGTGLGEDAQLKPLAPPGGGIAPPGGSPPGGNPMYPGSGGNPMYPGSGGNPTSPGGSTPSGSHIDVTLSDTVVLVQFEMEWKENTYQSILLPGIGRMTAQLKGRMAVLSGENDSFSLAASLVGVVKSKGSFPLGAIERDVRLDRYNLPYPPEQRVSLFAELLPYLGKAGLRTAIDRNSAWYDASKKNNSGLTNLAIAETWVPEFLVPYYDQSAWRATHELAEGRSLGATNYVGIAGLGLDAARYDPKDPSVQKKLGMYGYDWTSKPDDVTDGLSNTIALIQVPPGYQRPWIAGGGATLTGVDERVEKPMQPYVTKLPDGTRGTTVLMGDGSVRTVRESISPAVFKAMVTRSGGDDLTDFDKVAPISPKPKKSSVELTAGPVSSVKPNKDVDAAELKKLQGRWKAVVSIEQGKEAGADELKKDAVELNIAGTSFGIMEKGRKVPAGVITKLDAASSPKALDVSPPQGVPGGGSLLMAYECDGTKLKIRFTKDAKERVKSMDKPAAGDKSGVYAEFEKVE